MSFRLFVGDDRQVESPVMRNPPSDGKTVAEVIEAYLSEKRLLQQLGQYHRKSLDRAEHYLKSFAAMYGHKPASAGNRRQFVDWLLAHPEWSAPDTIGDAIGSVVTAFHWAEDQNPPLLERSGYKRFRDLIPQPRARACILPDEARAVLRAAKTRGYKSSRLAFRLAIYFLFETGARTCELRAARWELVDWDKQLLTIGDEHNKTFKKTGDARLIPLDGLIFRMLRWAWRKRGKPTEGHIFINGRGEPLKCGSFAHYFRTVADAAGIRREVSAYSLRHGFCVQALENGVGVKQLADVVGHASTKQIERRYGRSAKTRIKYMRETMRQARRGKKT